MYIMLLMLEPKHLKPAGLFEFNQISYWSIRSTVFSVNKK